MPTYFLDSSALVKAYRREAGTQLVVELIRSPNPIVISGLTHVEVSSALIRRARDAGFSPEALDVVLKQLDHEIAERFEVVVLSVGVMTRALEITRRHALRAADAIQLACALMARNDVSPQEHIFVASDQELNAASRAEQFNVLDPLSIPGTK